MKPFQAYTLCTSPRSGSTLLCRMLEAVPGAGSPNSHFHVPALSAWLEDYGLYADDYARPEEAIRAALAAAHLRGRRTAGWQTV